MNILRNSFPTTPTLLRRAGNLLLTVLLITSVAQPMKRRLDTTNLETTSKKPKLDTTSNMIKLQAEGAGEVIEISREAISHCPTLQNMLNDLGEDADLLATPIPVHNTTHGTLKHVVACLNTIQDGNEVENALTNYVKVLEPQALHALLLAANYLDIKPLLDACVKAWTMYCSPSQEVTSKKMLQMSNDKDFTLLPEISHQCSQQLLYLPVIKEWLLNPMVTTLNGNDYWIDSVCFNHDSTILASVGPLQPIKLWNVVNDIWTCTATLEYDYASVNSVCFNHDGTIIASGLGDNSVMLWKIVDGEWTCTATLEGHDYEVNIVSFNHDGTLLASGSTDKTIKLWKLVNDIWTCIATLKNDGLVNSVCFNHDSTILASKDAYNINLWKIVNDVWTCTATLKGHKSSINSLCFTQDILASGSNDKTIKLWKIVDGVWTCTATLEGHHDPVKSVSFTQEGTILVSGSEDNTIKLWEIVNDAWTCMATLQGHNDSVDSACFNHNSSILASGSRDKTVKLWNFTNLPSIKNFFDREITLEQAMFLKLVHQAQAAGQVLDLTQNDQAHLLVIFKSLPEWIQEFLIRGGFVKIFVQ